MGREFFFISTMSPRILRNWKGFLQEMVARGMRELAHRDGRESWSAQSDRRGLPSSLKQRCQKHRLENILGKAPKEVRDELKAAILESFHANSYEQGLKKGREVIRSVPSTIPERDEVHGRDPRSVSSGATPSCGASQKASHVEST